MPNYAQAAIQIRQKKEREAKEKESRGQQEEGGATSGQRVRTTTYTYDTIKYPRYTFQ